MQRGGLRAAPFVLVADIIRAQQYQRTPAAHFGVTGLAIGLPTDTSIYL
jgi:hypothetical protein